VNLKAPDNRVVINPADLRHVGPDHARMLHSYRREATIVQADRLGISRDLFVEIVQYVWGALPGHDFDTRETLIRDALELAGAGKPWKTLPGASSADSEFAWGVRNARPSA